MNHRDTKESVLIRAGVYSTTIYEMEIWTLANEQNDTDEDFRFQLENSWYMHCGLRRELVGLFPTKERALEDLEMMYEDPFAEDRELYCAFIREKAMCCMMQPNDYIKEWTYVYGRLHDETLVRNYDEEENPFYGRPKEMVRFKKGDIVMIPDIYKGIGLWGIVWGTPISQEKAQKVNERFKRRTGISENNFSVLDWTDDQYTILTDVKDKMVSHEHILAHYVLPASHVPEYVRNILEKAVQTWDEEDS